MAVSVSSSQGGAHSKSGQAVSTLRTGGGAGCHTGGAPHAAPYRYYASGAGWCGLANCEADKWSQES